MAIKNADTTLQSAPKAVVQPHPLCGEALPTNEFCEAGQPPRLDEYKEYTDWVPFFYAPPQYNFCKAFNAWYYGSCVPATQDARGEMRSIVQKNGNVDSNKEITDQINGTFNRTEDACAGIDPALLQRTAESCGSIIQIHNKNRWIMALGVALIYKYKYTILGLWHIWRSRKNIWKELGSLWKRIRADYEENGAFRATGLRLNPKRIKNGIACLWNARDSDFREEVTDINIFFAKLLEFSDSKEDRAAAIAKWNEVKKQKNLSAEKKFERFKEVIREEFGDRILDIIEEIERDIIEERVWSFKKIARSRATITLFMANAGLFQNSEEIRSRLSRLAVMLDSKVVPLDPKVFRKVMDAVQGLHFAAAHFKFNDAAKFTKDLLERLEGRGAAVEADILTDDVIPFAERLYAEFGRSFFEDIFPRLGDFMGQLHGALKKENHERLVEYFDGHLRTLLKYAGYLSDNLRGFTQLANVQRITAPDTLTPAWQTASGRFWGIIHDIGNVLGALRLTVDSVREGDMEYVKKFDLTNIKGIVETTRFINEKLAEMKGVEVVADEFPEVSIPRPSHVSAFRMVI